MTTGGDTKNVDVPLRGEIAIPGVEKKPPCDILFADRDGKLNPDISRP